MRLVGMIGYGAIGAEIARRWKSELGASHRLVSLLVRAHQVQEATRWAPTNSLVTSDCASFVKTAPGIVIEAAGHDVVAKCATKILERGCRLYLLSVGALADEDVRARLQAAATRGGGRIMVPAGALAGFDGLLSLRTAGLTSVRYTSTKPVKAWRGTAAERVCNLDGLREPRVIFLGSAHQAAKLFPRNANLAAAVALAGIGFDATQVRLIADPAAAQNSSRIEADSPAGQLDVTLTSPAFAANPKSSWIAALSAIAALRQQTESIAFK